MKELIVEAKIERINEVFDFINAELEHHTCPPELQSNINIAAEEIFTNIANYAYPSAKGNAVISITVGEEAVIRFEDTGKPYNPLEHPAPDLDKPLMERKIGGLGIFLVKNLMDKVEYVRMDDKNLLVLTKKIK